MSAKSKVVRVSVPLVSSAPYNTVHDCDSSCSYDTLHELRQPPRQDTTLDFPAMIRNVSHTRSITGSTCTERLYVPFSTPEYTEERSSPAMPPAIARNPRRKLAWMKARAQQARDRLMQEYSECEMATPKIETTQCFSAGMVPKRQRLAFVKEEELNCMLEDRVGTPHISELQLDEDVATHLNIQELGLAGAVDMLVDEEEQTDRQPEMAR